MMITVLSGGIGGAAFVRGLLDEVGDEAEVTVVGNTADDLWLFGLKVCPDLDTLMYTLGGGIDEERRWGRSDETWSVKEELAAYGAQPTWFGLGDRDVATHLVRTQMLQAGYPLSDVTRALCVRWQPGVTLLPMTDDRVETHVVVENEGQRRAIHFQEYWVRLRAAVPAHDVVMIGIEEAKPAPGVIEAVMDADVVLVPPSNPVVSVGPILAVAGVSDALRTTRAPVIGISPIIAGGAVRGMADQLLTALGVGVSAGAVGVRYGARKTGGVLDGWLVDTGDADQLGPLEEAGLVARAVPLYMSDAETTRTLAADALALAREVGVAR
ncbi:2-phospho-L-lactate transferase [Mumia sp.]|uniref:2-phospho-L-lactate transferase n=1 Tax=Mumia sp. TaxID=1965300 RepID=UPI00260D376C|nr:2-phospho-L-lactate transferase [Mumia sp.]MDD9348658.1 2-phospho-L-lactate transferase [Mumia sp.]